MPSKAVYTGLALARSDTGCSTVLIPWVEESVMVTPEVVGHIDPVCTVVLRRTARREIGSRPHQSLPSVPGMAAIAAAGLARLLADLGGVAGLQPLKGAVEVAGGQHDPAVGALGHHLGDGAPLVVGDAGVGGRRRQEDGRAGLVFRADRDPAHLAGSDVVADLEAENVAVEGQGGVRVVMREEARVDGDVHGGHTRCGWVTGASRFLTGLVTCCATHGGIPAVASAAWRR